MVAKVKTEQRSKIELLEEENELLRARLDEAEQTLNAIRSGEVDALVVSGPQGDQVFSLTGVDHPYRILVETMYDGAATLALDDTIIYGNLRLAAMLQLPIEKLIGTSFRTYVVPEDQLLFADHLKMCTLDSESAEMTVVTATGNKIPVLLSCRDCEFADNRGKSIVLTDISARKQTEEKILRLNRLYAALSALNHTIVHTTDREVVFREFCRVAVELGGFRLAWVGLVDKETGTVNVVAANGATTYLDGIRISAKLEPEGMGPTGISIREGRSYICNDFFSTGITQPWHERARAHDLCASASIAIKQNQEIIGALTLYAGIKDFFDSQQVDLLERMGEDVSFALDNLLLEDRIRDAELKAQMAIERERATEALREHQ